MSSIGEIKVNSNFKYIGEVVNNEANGKGIQTDQNGYTYEGDFKNNNKHGFIIKKNLTGSIIFEGYYLNDKKNGKGRLYSIQNNLLYDGNYLNDKKDGEGKLYEYGKLIFDGFWSMDQKIRGTIYEWKKLLTYIGELDNDIASGNGKIYKDDKLIYSGDFVNNSFHGFGELYTMNNSKFKKNLIFNIEKNFEGSIKYVGEFKNGQPDGKGIIYYKDEIRQEGEFIKGSLNGMTTSYNKDNQKINYGNYTNNCRDGIFEIYDKDSNVINYFTYKLNKLVNNSEINFVTSPNNNKIINVDSFDEENNTLSEIPTEYDDDDKLTDIQLENNDDNIESFGTQLEDDDLPLKKQKIDDCSEDNDWSCFI